MFVLSLLFAFSQQGDGGKPKGSKAALLIKSSQKVVFNEPNIQQLRTEDQINDEQGIGPWRFGFNNYTNLNLFNSGNWFTLPNGDQIWFLTLECTNALSVNLSFTETSIPEGNELYVYNPKKDFVLGKFSQYHLYEGQLGTELIPGSELGGYSVRGGEYKSSECNTWLSHTNRISRKSFWKFGFM